MAKVSSNKVSTFDDVNRELNSIRDVLKEMGLAYGNASPEGIVYADYGYIYRDKRNGVTYLKTTAKEQNTGWKKQGTEEELETYADGIIEESGSDYIRYKDGTQICWLHTVVNDQSISNAYGSLYQGTRGWTFPKAFSSAPAVQCSHFKWGTSASWGTISAVSTTTATLRGIDISSRATGTNTEISAIAVGKWK